MHTKNNGFSLIEMSILLAVLAVFAVGILTQLTTQKEYREITSVDNKMEKIREALDIYVSNNNYLPCPANGDVQISNASFGLVTDCTTAPTSGVVDIDDVDGAASDDDVRIGVLPVKELGLRADYMFDEWGNRFMYAVHKDLTNATSYAAYPSTSAGGIAVQDGAGAALNSGLVPYLIMSNGKDGRGAYTKAGVYNACSASTEDSDKSNCAWSTSTGAAALTFTADIIRDDATATDFFYDKLAWGEQQTITAPIFTTATGIFLGEHHACGLKRSGELWCWGDTAQGPTGISSPPPTLLVPTKVTEISTPWTHLHTDVYGTCGISAGQAYCWGRRRGGRIGDGGATTGSQETPIAVSNTSLEGDIIIPGSWKHITVDFSNGCGIADSDQGNNMIYCWGINHAGQLGNGTFAADDTIPHPTPQRVVNNAGTGFYTDWIYVASAYSSACGIRDNGSGTTGTLWCWGSNGRQEVKSPASTTRETRPVQQGSASNWTYVNGDDQNFCAINTNTELYCWGDNWAGQLGLGAGTAGPTNGRAFSSLTAPVGTGYSAASLSKGTICAIQNGAIKCAGVDTTGLLGNGSSDTSNHDTQQNVAGPAGLLNDFYNVHIIEGVGCAIRETGQVWCWGNNAFQAFGNDGRDIGVEHEPIVAADGELFN